MQNSGISTIHIATAFVKSHISYTAGRKHDITAGRPLAIVYINVNNYRLPNHQDICKTNTIVLYESVFHRAQGSICNLFARRGEGESEFLLFLKEGIKMNRVKKTISVILVILMVLALISSCATKSSSTDSDIPGTPDTNDASPSASQGLVVTSPEEISADPEANYAEELMVVIDNNPIVDFLPHSSSAGTSSTLWAENMIYDRLVGIDADGKYIPALALSWETDDWQTITMKLRDDVTFHSGEKFTASDVVFTINDAREATGTLSQEYWATVKEVTAIDDYTVKFVLDGVNVEFLYDCSQPWSSILSEKAMTEDPEKGYWIGTGAFMVSDFATSDYVELTRNDSYWGEKAITKTITLKYIPEESTRLMMLQNGEADACFSLNTNDYPVIENDPDNYEFS